jgi:hypothetical protein
MAVVWSSNVAGYTAVAAPAGGNEVYLHKFHGGTTSMVSSNGGVAADAPAGAAAIAGGGGLVTFASAATNLVSGVPAGVTQAYTRQY